MHDYLFSSEIVRFAFVFGICVSMMLYERLHLTTGSIVVPGYIAVFLVYPMVVIATFVNALVSYALINHVLRKRFILYGRAKFTLMALISISIQTAMLKLSPSGPWLWESNIPLFVGAGYVVPALIAHDMGRQGIKRTSKAVLLAGVIVATPIGVALALQLNGVNDLAPLAGFGTMSIDSGWIPIAVLLSAAASWAVATNYNFKSGGFVGAAYVGMLMGDPYQVAVVFTIALVTFVIVRYVLMNYLILFGRRKFSSMLLISSMIFWTLMWVGPSIFGARVNSHLDLASLALTPLFVPGLLANDMDRTSPLRVVAGAGLGGAFVVSTTWWIQSIVEGRPLELPWKLLSIATFLVIFWKTMRQLYRHYRPTQTADDEVVVGAQIAPAETPLRSPLSVDGELELVAIAVAATAALDGDAEPTEELSWPLVDRRKAGRPWTERQAELVADEDLPALQDWRELVPTVLSIDSSAWSPKGNQRWQDLHPDAWEDADRWLAEALTPKREQQVA